ncbi:hypothetical protein PLICRDRAFT_170670 [Plicaturopsis crispa FD-325 SS-3]|nr:hypothetical protein PLICRDRAFT_170670 [Plicaturopsis crispa FD-325 SS-3]
MVPPAPSHASTTRAPTGASSKHYGRQRIAITQTPARTRPSFVHAPTLVSAGLTPTRETAAPMPACSSSAPASTPASPARMPMLASAGLTPTRVRQPTPLPTPTPASASATRPECPYPQCLAPTLETRCWGDNGILQTNCNADIPAAYSLHAPTSSSPTRVHGHLLYLNSPTPKSNLGTSTICASSSPMALLNIPARVSSLSSSRLAKQHYAGFQNVASTLSASASSTVYGGKASGTNSASTTSLLVAPSVIWLDYERKRDGLQAKIAQYYHGLRDAWSNSQLKE